MKFIRLKTEEFEKLPIFQDMNIVDGVLKNATFYCDGFLYQISSGYDCLVLSSQDYDIKTKWEIVPTRIGLPSIRASFDNKNEALDFIEKIGADDWAVNEVTFKTPKNECAVNCVALNTETCPF